MKMFFPLIFCVLLHTSPIDPDALINLHDNVSVNNCVDPITGNFFYGVHDLTIEGIEPIHIVRNYNSKSDTLSYDGGWKFFPQLTLYPQRVGGEVIFLYGYDSTGMYVKYQYASNNNYSPKIEDIKGIKNTNADEISGRTNIKNNKIELVNDFWVLTSGDGSKKYYKNEKYQDIFYLEKEQKPNGNWIFYTYDSQKRLTSIKTTNPSVNKTYAQIEIFNYGDKKAKCHDFDVKSNDNLLSYRYYRPIDKHVHDYFYLNKIFHADFSEELNYSIPIEKRKKSMFDKDIAPLLNNIYQGINGLKVNYYIPCSCILNLYGTTVQLRKASDLRSERVMTLTAPVGIDGSFIPLYFFKYDLSNSTPKNEKDKYDGTTYVKDLINDNEIIYKYNDSLQITNIEYNTGEYNYLTKTYNYHDNNLTNKRILSNTGEYVEHIYNYDDKGNVLEYSFLGNLSGKSIDKYTKRFSYTNDGFNLPLKKTEDTGLVVNYAYKPGTDLITYKITSDNKNNVFKRQFYEYNDDNVLIKEFIDDNNTLDISDTSNVSTRKIKYIILTDNNLVKEVHEKYLDEDVEKLLYITCFHYSNDNQITQEDVFDTNGKYAYSIFNKYNIQGVLIEKKDPIGRISYCEYDKEKRLIKSKNHNLEEFYFYDQANRLIRKEEKTVDQTRVYNYKYDAKNNKVLESDFRNVCIEYIYDNKNDLIGKKCFNRILNYEHNAFNQETKFIDANKNTTYKEYNAYGKTKKIIHPNNTCEHYYYDLSGNLIEYIDQDNIQTFYTHDCLNRLLNKEVYSKSKELIFREENTYDGFNLISHKNADGYFTYYFYDKAGRKIKEDFHNTKHIETIEYECDSLGYLYKTSFINKDNILVYITVNDKIGRVIEERKEDKDKNIFTKKLYEYDDNDNVISETIFCPNASKTLYKYDAYNRLTKKIDAQGNISKTIYNDYYINALNQKVLCKTSIDLLLIETIEIFDIFDNLVYQEKKDSKTQASLSKEHYYYDDNNNLIKQISEVISQDTNRLIERCQTYDSMNQITSTTEATQKTFLYAYNNKGLLEAITKPDGVSLYKKYDELNREIHTFSSDNTCNYLFQYSPSGFLTNYVDLRTNESVKRELDGKGNILKEESKYPIIYEYDKLGRNIKTILFDNSIIEKEYNALFLKKVIRNTNQYIHRYLNYDLAGNLLQEQTITNNKIKHIYDDLNRPLSIQSKHFTHKILEYDKNSKIKKTSYNNAYSFYEYDALEQLIEEKGVFSNKYNFDSHYNRLSKNQDIYTINDLNEIVSINDNIYEYDFTGNLIYANDTYYKYDAFDRLIEVLKGKIKYCYKYDALHRRLNKTAYDLTTNEIIEETDYLYDKDNEIGEVQNNEIITLRILSDTSNAEIGSSIAIEHLSDVYLPLHDLHGNITCLINKKSDSKIEEYEYSSFGEERIYIKEVFDNQTQLTSNHFFEKTYYPLYDEKKEAQYDFCTKDSINPWRFSSKRKDEETSFIYFGRRYYDPSSGKWITTDPKGYKDSLNLYAFVLNNPLTHLDLYGLEILYHTNDNYMWATMYDINHLQDSNPYEKELKELTLSCKQHAHVQIDKDVPGLSASSGNWSLKYFHYIRGQTIGFCEGVSGKNAPAPISNTESLGREIGRAKAKFLGTAMMASSPFISAFGANMFVGGATLIVCTGGTLAPVGGAINSTGIGTMAAGAGIGMLGASILMKSNNLKDLNTNNYNKDAIRNKYAGQLKSFELQTGKQLKKSIRSFDKLIDNHAKWINNPSSKIAHWKNLDPNHQKNLIYHWEQDITRAQKYKKMAERTLRSKYG